MKKLKKFFTTPEERRMRRQMSLRVTILCVVFAVIAACSFVYYMRTRSRISLSDARQLWEQSDYQGVYRITRDLLEKKPFDNAALAYRGFSAFYLSASETDSNQAQFYLDEAIVSMRKAFYRADKRILARLSYMLGKAYFYKNTISSYHYYADLAVAYLTRAREMEFEARDIPELLGLSYAALGMTEESIAAFTDALKMRDSDTLKLAIAEQYYKSGRTAQAGQYLFEVAGSSTDDILVMKSRFLLGSIYLDEEKFDDARIEFQAITRMDPSSPEGYYGMGLLHEKQGNYARARAEWRTAQRYDPNHAGAADKLANSK
jgi:tetratricopeptide (TPR) repeat protein